MRGIFAEDHEIKQFGGSLVIGGDVLLKERKIDM